VELPSLDLNLMVVLHALLEERNVTRAGERVGLSQPGTSAALARLRRHFDDPLLDRVGTTYELTPLARALQGQVADTIRRLHLVLTARPDFDPATSERQFIVRCSDSVQTLLGPALVREVTSAGPGISLDIQPLDTHFALDPTSAVRDIDVMIAPCGFFTAPELHSVELYQDHWICVTASDNDAVGDELDAEQIAEARWVVAFRELPMNSPIDTALAALGVDRRSAVKVQNLTVLHRMVADTDLLVIAHELVAGDLAAQGLRQVRLPVVLPPIIETAWSHHSHQLDPGHHWLMEQIQRACDDVRQRARSSSRWPSSQLVTPERRAEETPVAH